MGITMIITCAHSEHAFLSNAYSNPRDWLGYLQNLLQHALAHVGVSTLAARPASNTVGTQLCQQIQMRRFLPVLTVQLHDSVVLELKQFGVVASVRVRGAALLE